MDAADDRLRGERWPGPAAHGRTQIGYEQPSDLTPRSSPDAWRVGGAAGEGYRSSWRMNASASQCVNRFSGQSRSNTARQYTDG